MKFKSSLPFDNLLLALQINEQPTNLKHIQLKQRQSDRDTNKIT